MDTNVLKAITSRRFVARESDFKRLTRLGWDWSCGVDERGQPTRTVGIMPAAAPTVLLDDDAFAQYQQSLTQWAALAYASTPGAPRNNTPGEGLGSEGGNLGGGRRRRRGRRSNCGRAGALGAGVTNQGMGYHPDLPDHRDHRIGPRSTIPQGAERILERILEKNLCMGRGSASASGGAAEAVVPTSYLLTRDSGNPLPDFHDLRYTGHFSPVENQGPLGSCTAQALIGMVEYLQRAGRGEHDDMSRLFNYKTSRHLLGWDGDSGAYMRTALKALALFGTPPEAEWPHDIEYFDDEPEAYHYAYAQNFKAMDYTRLDGSGASAEEVLDLLKRTLLDGFPVVFGFTVHDSIAEVSADNGFVIPFPDIHDKVDGGHAVVAVGYDDQYLDEPATSGGTKGALIIRNSWGTAWGEAGYGYLPTDYIRAALARDFWTVFNTEWFELSAFD